MNRSVLYGHTKYAILFLCFLLGCVSRDEPKPNLCEDSDLAIALVSQTDPTGCTSSDGKIIVTATGGTGSYEFAIDNNEYVESAEFGGLGAGVFTLYVKDSNGCEQSLEVTLTVPGSTLAASVTSQADDQCLTDNGTLTVTASGGFPPYQYKLGTDAFSSTSSFSNLKNGTYTITVKDDSGCTLSLSTPVARGNTGVSYSGEVKSIITTKCATSRCHGGNQSPNLTVFSNLTANSKEVKSRIESGSMPPTGNTQLTADEKAKIICWIDDGTNNN